MPTTNHTPVCTPARLREIADVAVNTIAAKVLRWAADKLEETEQTVAAQTAELSDKDSEIGRLEAQADKYRDRIRSLNYQSDILEARIHDTERNAAREFDGLAAKYREQIDIAAGANAETSRQIAESRRLKDQVKALTLALEVDDTFHHDTDGCDECEEDPSQDKDLDPRLPETKLHDAIETLVEGLFGALFPNLTRER